MRGLAVRCCPDTPFRRSRRPSKGRDETGERDGGMSALTHIQMFPQILPALRSSRKHAIPFLTKVQDIAGPALFGVLIDTGSRETVFAGYLLGSALMIAAALIAWRY